MPTAVAKYADIWQFDQISYRGLIFAANILAAAKATRAVEQGPSDALYRAIAVRAFHSRELDTDRALSPLIASRNHAIRADELNNTELTNYGAEFSGDAWDPVFWDEARTRSRILPFIAQIEIPDGFEELTVPVALGRPQIYSVEQAADNYLNTNPGLTAPVARTSRVQTGQAKLFPKKIASAVTWATEITEDSAIRWADAVMTLIARRAAHVFDSMIVDGDTDDDDTNISRAGTALADLTVEADKENPIFLVDGIRKYALGQAANIEDAGDSVYDPNNMFTLLGTINSEGVEIEDYAYIAPVRLYQDIWQSIIQGRVNGNVLKRESDGTFRLFGYRFIPTPDYSPSTSGLSNADGKISTTAADNTQMSYALARLDQWLWGWKQRADIVVQKKGRADVFELTSHARVALTHRRDSTTAAAIALNLGR